MSMTSGFKFVPLIITRNVNGETRWSILACGTASDPVFKGLTTNSLHGMIKIVIQELSPLHDNVSQISIRSDFGTANQFSR